MSATPTTPVPTIRTKRVNPWRRTRPGAHPPLICLTGIDGCGKSTQATLLEARLQADGWNVARVWTGGRPYVSRPLVKLAKRYLHAPRSDATGQFHASSNGSDEFAEYLSNSNRMFRNHRLLRRGWIDVSLLEHAAEADLTVWPHLRRGRAVVCDRYLFKSIVNLAVLLDTPINELHLLLRHPALRIVPAPTLYALLDVPAEVGFSRKTDLPSLEYVRRRVPIYRALAALTNMPVIDATQSPETIAGELYGVVERTLARSGLRPAATAISEHG